MKMENYSNEKKYELHWCKTIHLAPTILFNFTHYSKKKECSENKKFRKGKNRKEKENKKTMIERRRNDKHSAHKRVIK